MYLVYMFSSSFLEAPVTNIVFSMSESRRVGKRPRDGHVNGSLFLPPTYTRPPAAFQMDQILAELKKIPPVTRFICGSSLAVTGVTIANIVSPYSILFVRELVFKKFEVRLFSLSLSLSL